MKRVLCAVAFVSALVGQTAIAGEKPLAEQRSQDNLLRVGVDGKARDNQLSPLNNNTANQLNQIETSAGSNNQPITTDPNQPQAKHQKKPTEHPQ